MRYYLILLLLCFIERAWSNGPVSFESKWEKLLFKQFPSKDPFFYLTKHPLNTENEKQELIKAMSDPNYVYGQLKLHPACLYPMRVKLLERNNLIEKNSKIECLDLVEWKKGISPNSLSVVFSSAYIDNPSSMFGHTLIKFNKHPVSIPHLNNLNYVGAYSAEVDSSDPGILYAIKGILGGYQGEFSLAPYYMKQREYVRAESRDLWEYEIDLSQEELDDFLDVYWEAFVAGKFPYYFLTENCSMLLARLLDMVLPDLKLTSGYKLFVLPSEFVRKIAESDRLKSVGVTQGHRRVFYARYQELSHDQKKQFKNNLEYAEIKTDDPLVLRTLSEFYGYKKNDNEGNVDELHKKKELEIRKKLASITHSNLAQTKLSEPNNRPDQSHQQWPIVIGAFKNQDYYGSYLKWRYGFHDLYDNDKGNEIMNEIKLLDSQVNISKEGIRLNRLGLVEMTSLPNYRTFDPRYSWKVKTAIVQEAKKVNHLTPNAELSVGFSHRSKEETFLIAFMPGLETFFDNHFYILNIPIIFKNDLFSLGVESKYYYQIKNYQRGLKEHFNARLYFSKNISLEVDAMINFEGQSLSRSEYEIKSGLRMYF